MSAMLDDDLADGQERVHGSMVLQCACGDGCYHRMPASEPVIPAQRREAGELEERRRDVGQDAVGERAAREPPGRPGRTAPG